MLPGKGEKGGLALEIALDALALVRRHGVPLVDGDHDGTAGLEDEARKMRILLRDSLLGVEYQHDDIGILDRLQRLDHREFLDGFEHLAAAAHAGGVDQRVPASVALEIDVDRVARRPWLVECDHPFFPEQRVDERRLADVGSTDDRDPNGLLAGLRACVVRGWNRGRRHGQGELGKLRDVFAVGGRNRVRLTEPELVELVRRAAGCQPLRLVGGENDGPAGAAQKVGDVTVLLGQPLPGVDHEDHDIGLGDCLACLPGHFVKDAVLRHRFEPTRVDDQIGPVADPPPAIMSIAGQPGKIGDERGTRPRQAIEQRRLADIGAADENDGGKHGRGYGGSADGMRRGRNAGDEG